MSPLTDLTKKGLPNIVQWGMEQQGAFETLKRVLSNDPVSKFHNFGRALVLRTNASISPSNMGVEAVLLQKYGDKYFSVVYIG